MNDIVLQRQVSEEENIPMYPAKFSLRWGIEYPRNVSIFSEWTPSLNPSITKTLDGKNNGKFLVVEGNNQWSNYVVELARIKFKLIKKFGYIAEQTALKNRIIKKSEIIIGMWIELKNNKKINIYVNGNIKEIER